MQIRLMSTGVKPDASSSAMNDSAAFVVAWRVRVLTTDAINLELCTQRSPVNKAMMSSAKALCSALRELAAEHTILHLHPKDVRLNSNFTKQ